MVLAVGQAITEGVAHRRQHEAIVGKLAIGDKLVGQLLVEHIVLKQAKELVGLELLQCLVFLLLEVQLVEQLVGQQLVVEQVGL